MRVKIYRPLQHDPKIEEALRRLLVEIGCEIAADEDAPDEVDATDEAVPEDEVLVVVLGPDCSQDENLRKRVKTAVKCACRVVGIWPPGSAGGTVPDVIERYGCDVVPWDAAKVRNAVTAAAPQWETPKGAPRPEPYTRRNKC